MYILKPSRGFLHFVIVLKEYILKNSSTGKGSEQTFS